MCRDSLIGLPLCRVSSRATSSARSIRRSPSLRTSRPRSRADICAHGPLSAARADSTASFRSSASADATEAHTSSVAGLMTSMVLPDAAGRHWLLMKSCFCSAMATDMCTPRRVNTTAQRHDGTTTYVCVVSSRRRDVVRCLRQLVSSVLPPSELRCPLLQVRSNAFLRVLSLEEQLLQLPLDRQAFEEPGLGT